MHRLFLIDTFSLLFQVFHAIPPMTGPKGEPTNAVFGFTRDLKQILANNRPSHVVVCMESEGDGTRSETYADYKA
ncbi:MAG: PIN domain-containing protein, partial [Planctomycetota bacterium]